MTHIYNELVEKNILPSNYDYTKIRKLLVENNLITIGDRSQTIATEYSLENKLFFISDKHYYSTGDSFYYSYLISDEGKRIITGILSAYSREFFIKQI